MNDADHSPFHAGEVAIQRSLGVADRMADFGRRVVRDHMPDQHRQFYAQLPFLVAATVDPDGRPWATLIEGPPGFAQSPDPRRLTIDRQPAPDDPALAGWHADAAVGLLGIELHSRRRNRVNGTLQATDAGLQLQVEHAFGNCPQYIALRWLAFAREPGTPGAAASCTGRELDASLSRFIAACDTFFVASYVDHADGRRAVDASHRGGKPGFVRVRGQRLTVPDFAGNLHFNTLGNLRLNPRVGLVFVDFRSGDLLHLSGQAVLDFDAAETADFQGAERLWQVDVDRWVLRRNALALRADTVEMSPQSALTGSWEDAAARQRAALLGAAWRPFRIVRVETESRTIRSFWLEPTDGQGLATFAAGQHVPLRVPADPDGKAVERSYSLSSAPADGAYRISVRVQGQVSGFLHRHGEVGHVLEIRAPRGRFQLDATAQRPLALISAGVGITPMLSMLRQVVYEGLRSRKTRRTWFFHGARNTADRAFHGELIELAEAARGAVTIVQALSQPTEADLTAGALHHRGRIDIALLERTLPLAEVDFYLCGPAPFMQSLYAGLRALQVAEQQIHAEAFGPAGLLRDTRAALAAPAQSPVAVHFTVAQCEVQWQPGVSSLLALAESIGLAPVHACRQGICGSCIHTLRRGCVTYPQAPAPALVAGEVLLCQAVPAEGSEGLQIDA